MRPSIRCYIDLNTRLIDGIFVWKRGCCMGNRPSINLVSRRGRLAVFFFEPVNWKKNWRSRLSEDEIAGFLTKIERKKCKNSQYQNLLLNGCYLLFEEYEEEKNKKKTSVYILKPYREIGQSLEESLRGGKLIKNLEIFWMNNKIIT